MAKDRIGPRIESLIAHENWKAAQSAIEKQLQKEPADHWLWARFSGVKYEQRDYQGALEAGVKALAIVPDCPLAVWSCANALEMLGAIPEAKKVFSLLSKGARDELVHPDADADECWEGSDWTTALMADCIFRIAGCEAKLNRVDMAVQRYQDFLALHDSIALQDLGATGIYSREDALARLRKLMPSKSAQRSAAVRTVEKMNILAKNMKVLSFVSGRDVSGALRGMVLAKRKRGTVRSH